MRHLYNRCTIYMCVVFFVFCSHSSTVAQIGDPITPVTVPVPIGPAPIPVHIDVPTGLQSYNGWAPINFGVPFPRGYLNKGVVVSLCDQNQNPVLAEITVTATWEYPHQESSETVYVKWLLVESIVEIQKGSAPSLFLCLGQEGSIPNYHPLFVPPPEPINQSPDYDYGSFEIEDGNNFVYEAASGIDESILERDNDLFKVYRIEGSYRNQASDQALGSYVTRIRSYKNQPYVKLMHTMIWTGSTSEGESVATSDNPCPNAGAEQLNRLSYQLPQLKKITDMEAGWNGKPVKSNKAIYLQQFTAGLVNKYTLEDTTLDGWLQTTSNGTNASVFAAVRWPWQQFPIRIFANKTEQRLDLYAPTAPTSLTGCEITQELITHESQYATEQLEQLRDFASDKWNVPENDLPGGSISPRGMAKTYEILLWKNDTSTEPAQRNEFLQTPVVAYADPAFTTRANLPSPVNEKNLSLNRETEMAIESFFRWVTARHEEQGDYGAWSFGEIQYDWLVKYWGPPMYRYWMNNGRGWSVVPWLLWLRSGERDYLHEAEQNSRHVMDVDTSHILEWDGASDFKHRGGVYSYAPVQAALGPGKVADRYGDSEYLSTYFYLTGYERAWDVLKIRKDALTQFNHSPVFDYTVDQFSQGDVARNTYRTLGELAIAYEATHDSTIRELATAYIDYIASMQRDDGLMPGFVSNFWFSQSMNIAARAIPERRQVILNMLQHWNEFRGDVIQSGSTGNVIGPMSLWTLRSLSDDDNYYSQLAWQIMRVQTIGVHTTKKAVGVCSAKNHFEGFSGLAGHESGWFLRDWLVALQMSEEYPIDKSAWHPVSHVHGLLDLTADDASDGWQYRHVAFIHDKKDEPITVKSQYLFYNLGSAEYKFKYRLYDPDGMLIFEKTADIPKQNESGQPATIDVSIPVDEKTGAYALEILGTEKVPVNLKADGAELVHTFNGLKLIAQSADDAGMIFGMNENGVKFLAEFPDLERAPRTILYDDQDMIVTMSCVDGDLSKKDDGITTGAANLFDGNMPTGIVGVLTQNKNRLYEMSLEGLQPYISTSKSDWYDPSTHVNYVVNDFLNP